MYNSISHIPAQPNSFCCELNRKLNEFEELERERMKGNHRFVRVCMEFRAAELVQLC